MSAIVLGKGTHPIRMDLIVHAGQPLRQVIPVYDAAGELLDLTQWAASAEVLGTSTPVLGEITLDHDDLGLTLRATGEQTLEWVTLWPGYSQWRIRAAHPSGEPVFSTNGWLALYP